MRGNNHFLAPLWRGATIALFVLACLGCERLPNQVHFILPDGYRGSFAIQPDDKAGIELKKVAGHYVVRIPESGLFKMKGYDPFQSYLNTAAFASGKPIWVEKRIDDKPAPGEVGLWSVGTSAWYENGKPINQYYWFVGTEEEWRARDGESQYQIGGVRKKQDR